MEENAMVGDPKSNYKKCPYSLMAKHGLGKTELPGQYRVRAPKNNQEKWSSLVDIYCKDVIIKSIQRNEYEQYSNR